MLRAAEKADTIRHRQLVVELATNANAGGANITTTNPIRTRGKTRNIGFLIPRNGIYRIVFAITIILLVILGVIIPLSISFKSAGVRNSEVIASIDMTTPTISSDNKETSERSPTSSLNAQTEYETVAYLISITTCKKRFENTINDGGAVLKKSIDLNSYPLNKNSRYKNDAFILVTPETANSNCVAILQKAGFAPILVDFPVNPDKIQQVEGYTELRKDIRRDGCCGEKEFIKLHAYSMTDYKVAIHLDLDTLVVKPMDPIFDAMVFPPNTKEGLEARKRLFAPENRDLEFPYRRLASALYTPDVPLEELAINAYYTKDYNMFPRNVQNRGGKVGMQGGVIIVRPNNATRDEIIRKVESGLFYEGRDKHSGWFKKGYG